MQLAKSQSVKTASFDSRAELNALVWITSVPAEELGLTNRTTEDLKVYSERQNIEYLHYFVSSCPEISAIFDELVRKCRTGLRPIIQLDMHGSKIDGLLLSPSKEYYSWPLLIRKLRCINVETKNNLCVVAAACFSFTVTESLDILEPTPFFAIVAPDGPVTEGYLEDNLIRFYQHLFEKRDFGGAYEKHLRSKMKLLHSEKVFALVFTRYIRRHCIGGGRDRRLESLLTEGLRQVGNNRENRRLSRSLLKRAIRPYQQHLDYHAQIFLCGKSVSYKIEDLDRLARANPEARFRQPQSRR